MANGAGSPTAESGRRLSLFSRNAKVNGQDIEHAGPSAQGIYVQVRARGNVKGPWSDLVSTVLAPNAKGVVNADLVKVPVKETFRQVCVTAIVGELKPDHSPKTSAADACPGKDFRGVWALLQRPA